MRKIVSFIVLIVLFTAFGCNKDDYAIPHYQVRFSVSLLNPANKGLTSFLGSVIIPEQGIKGIIVTNTGGNPLYRAFDLLSTVNVEERNQLELDESGLHLVDKKSGAKFYVRDGNPAYAPAKRTLREYRVSKQGDLLYISN